MDRAGQVVRYRTLLAAQDWTSTFGAEPALQDKYI